MTYDKEQFQKYHTLPTAYAAETYLRARIQHTKDLVAAYQPAINALTKAKKFAEATALDDDLNELVRSARGYGLAFPDLEFNPVFVIENKHAGLVVDTTNKNGTGDLVLTEKVGRQKPSQCWRLERDESVWYIKNVMSGRVFYVVNASRTAGTTIITAFINPKTESDKRSVFTLTEVHRAVTIESGISSMILTATERKEKDVTITYVTQEKKEATPSAAQLWTLTEAK